MTEDLEERAARARAELTAMVRGAGRRSLTTTTLRERAARRRIARSAVVLSLLLVAGSGVILTRPAGDDQSTVVADRPRDATNVPAPPDSTSTTIPVVAPAATSPTTNPASAVTTKPAPGGSGSTCASAPTPERSIPGAVQATNDGAIWTLLQRGVLVSRDGGRSWTWRCMNLPRVGTDSNRPVTPADWMTHLVAQDENHAVAFGWDPNFSPSGDVIYTDDGGKSWASGRLPENRFSKNLNDADFVSSSTGWLVGSYRNVHTPAGALVLHTTDAGHTWTAQPFPQSAALELLAVSFTDEQHGWVAGDGGSEGRLFRTNDGGQTWTSVALPSSTGRLIDLTFVDGMHGYVLAYPPAPTGDRRILLATDDGGQTWRSTAFDNSWLSRLVATSSGHAIAVGGPTTSGAPRGEVVVTADRGTTWRPGDVAGLPPLFEVSVAPARAWAAGNRPCLFASADGGRTWTPFPLTPGAACSGP